MPLTYPYGSIVWGLGLINTHPSIMACWGENGHLAFLSVCHWNWRWKTTFSSTWPSHSWKWNVCILGPSSCSEQAAFVHFSSFMSLIHGVEGVVFVLNHYKEAPSSGKRIHDSRVHQNLPPLPDSRTPYPTPAAPVFHCPLVGWLSAWMMQWWFWKNA